MTYYRFKRIFLIKALWMAPLILALAFIAFSSFIAHRVGTDFMKQMGISKNAADVKITNSILGGSVDLYGTKTAKNILLGNRKAVVLDLLEYTKEHVNSETFIKEYNRIKEEYKPKETVAQTVEELRAKNIELAKKSVDDLEVLVQKAEASLKPVFEKTLIDARKNLKDLEDPNNKQYVRYAKNFDTYVKDLKSGHQRQLADWEKKYPANQLLYVKMRLEEFMNATKDIDFGAELTVKNGKKIFVKPEYERKDSRWKMAFRAGKEVVEPAREFVGAWIQEIQ